MGAMADAIMAYAQPLIDETDGSIEQMNKATQLVAASAGDVAKEKILVAGAREGLGTWCSCWQISSATSVVWS